MKRPSRKRQAQLWTEAQRPSDVQLPLVLDAPPLAPATIAEAERRGLRVGPEITEGDRPLIGEIGGLIAGLNNVTKRLADAGIEVILAPHYQDRPDGPKRCILRGRLRRVAYVAGI